MEDDCVLRRVSEKKAGREGEIYVMYLYVYHFLRRVEEIVVVQRYNLYVWYIYITNIEFLFVVVGVASCANVA